MIGSTNWAALKNRSSKPERLVAKNAFTKKMLATNRAIKTNPLKKMKPHPSCPDFLARLIMCGLVVNLFGVHAVCLMIQSIIQFLVWPTTDSNMHKPSASETDHSSNPAEGSSIGVKVLFAVLIVWGLLIAIGSFQTQASTDFRRPLIVGLTMSIFLGVWALALKSRANKR